MAKLAAGMKLSWIRQILTQRADDDHALTSTDTIRSSVAALGGPKMTREQLNIVGRGISSDGIPLCPDDSADTRRIFYISSQWSIGCRPDQRGTTRRCFACDEEASGIHWIYGGYYFACRDHTNREPDDLHPDLRREALDRLSGRPRQ